MWNDTDEPIAYFITFRTYGTWLHGDERGSVNRHHNRYGTSKIRPEQKWRKINSTRLLGEPITLNSKQRACVRNAILETCRIREWTIMALNIRTNHVHVVVTALGKPPGIVLNAFKANSTRLMRDRKYWSSDRSPWVDKGSTRYLWNEESVILACNYVEFGQGDTLPEFE
ncbi:MAG: transposase [Pyrinomonadaceae bacterium]